MALNEAANSPQGDFVGGLITPDRRKAAVQVLLKDGDNQAMQRVVDCTESFPLPVGTRAEWAGETYLNLVWQDKMVSGMMKAFGSNFVVILVLALLLFH